MTVSDPEESFKWVTTTVKIIAFIYIILYICKQILTSLQALHFSFFLLTKVYASYTECSIFHGWKTMVLQWTKFHFWGEIWPGYLGLRVRGNLQPVFPDFFHTLLHLPWEHLQKIAVGFHTGQTTFLSPIQQCQNTHKHWSHQGKLANKSHPFLNHQ